MSGSTASTPVASGARGGAGEAGGPGSPARPGPDTDTGGGQDRWRSLVDSWVSSSVLLSVLAVLLSLVVGAVLIAATDPGVHTAARYFFARPGDTLSAVWHSVSGAYSALWRGGVYNASAGGFAAGITPLMSSLAFATPLIAAGLGIAVAFRAGLFNIGGQGQILVGGALAGWVGFAWTAPTGVHLLVAVLAGLAGGAFWAGVVGLLKARTGAHEVIVTIMLNYVAFYLLDELLHTPVLRAPGSQDPKSPPELPTAVLPHLLGARYPLDLGFVLVVAATLATGWLLRRSALGFRFRAVGENPRAARVAGIDVPRTYVAVMVVSGALVGLAGVYQVLGQTPTGFGGAFDAGIGFNAITVALLGRSRPWGVFAAGVLFGIFQAGGYTMQALQGVDIDIVSVVQSIIVLFIAAPPLVRTIFHLPAPRRSA